MRHLNDSILKKFGTTLLLASLSVLLSLLASEAVLRWLGYQAIYELYSKPSVLWTDHPTLGWIHEPSSSGFYVGPRPWPIEYRTPIEINSLGLRGPEIVPVPTNGARVLILGDSMVAAFEVPYESTFIALVEQELTERLGRPVQVINGGVRGYGTDQAYLLYREVGAKLRPDLVVFFHSQNDLRNNITLHRMRRLFGKPAFAQLGDGSLALRNAPVPAYDLCSAYHLDERFEIVRDDGPSARLICRAQMKLFDHSALFSFLTLLVPWERIPGVLSSFYYAGIPKGENRKRSESEPNPDYRHHLTRNLIDHLNDAVRAEGARFLLIGLPGQLDAIERDIRSFRDYPVLRLHRVANADREKARFHHDSHFNRYGHRLVAQELAPKLIELLESIPYTAHTHPETLETYRDE